MFRIKFPTKRTVLTFRILILRTGGMASFCDLFMERPSYNLVDLGGSGLRDSSEREAMGGKVHRIWTG